MSNTALPSRAVESRKLQFPAMGNVVASIGVDSGSSVALEAVRC